MFSFEIQNVKSYCDRCDCAVRRARTSPMIYCRFVMCDVHHCLSSRVMDMRHSECGQRCGQVHLDSNGVVRRAVALSFHLANN